MAIEEPFEIADVIGKSPKESVLLLDCLTLWLTNILLADHDFDAEFENLISALKTAPSQIVIVSNEVGQGIVPDNALSRKFRAQQGRLNRLVAAEADAVVGVMAGLPFALKGELPE